MIKLHRSCVASPMQARQSVSIRLINIRSLDMSNPGAKLHLISYIGRTRRIGTRLCLGQLRGPSSPKVAKAPNGSQKFFILEFFNEP
jgi:hypothetical protein